MREIKFRAWDPYTKKMDYDCRDALSFWNGITVPEGDHIPLQFTGSNDKTGKEIYDGDVVSCGERVGIGRLLKRVKGQVHYVDSCACFCVQISDGDQGFVSWEFGHYADFKVIGNIYENPELLNPSSSS